MQAPTSMVRQVVFSLHNIHLSESADDITILRYVSHFSPNRPNCDSQCFGFFPRNMLKGVPNKYHTQSIKFSEIFFGVYNTKKNSKN